MGDRHFQEAIANGQRNREAIQRMLNWCGNARVQCDGRGMLADATGLPIGHHSIQCDFASDDTISSHFEVSDATIDFHDRNCIGCTHRKPVRLPNISEYLGERDRERQRRDAEATRAQAAAAQALAAREQARRTVRERLSPIGQTLIDDIGAFDRDRSEENRLRLMRSAEMAPEHFSAELQEYILGVCETERWLDAAGLDILATLGSEPVRLARVATQVLTVGVYRDLAARVLIPLVEHLEEADARNATPGAIELAAPDPRGFLGGTERRSDPTLLHLLYRHHPTAVDSALETMLSSGSTRQSERSARGLTALLRAYPGAADVHARSLISTYVRAQLALTDFSERESNLNAVATAIVGAFDARPAEIDALLQDYSGATGSIYRERVHELYARAIRAGYDEELPPASERVRIAFQRLLWATTGSFDEGVMKTAAEAFRDRSKDLVPVAALEIEAVLSAPFLLADRLREQEKAPLDQNHPLPQIQRGNELNYYRTLTLALIGLAARAAAEDPALLPKIGGFLDAIPAEREHLRGIAIECLVELAHNVEGLRLYLPHLYRAMVGPSSLERAGAAKAMGELRQEALQNLPPLVFESFVPLLLDSYVIVHQAAARALRSTLLPDPLRREALGSLLELIRHYRTVSGKDSFLLHCVRTLAGSADAFGAHSGAIRQYLVDLCMDIDPMYVRSELRSLSLTLGMEPAFAKLVVRMLPHLVDRFNQSDLADRIVGRLESSTVLAYAEQFEAVGRELARADHWLTILVVDALARAGGGAAAMRVARARIDALEDNARNRGQRLFGERIELAFQFEEAVAAGDEEARARIAARCIEIGRELQARREQQRERDRRRGIPFPN